MRLDPALPFILFDDARTNAPVRVYQGEVGRITARTFDAVRPALEDVREALRSGLHVAGRLAYEAGGAFEPRMAASPPDGPLLSFGIYERAAFLDWSEIAAPAAGRGAEIGPLRTAVTEAQHAEAIAAILSYIHAGDIYQANLTLPVETDYRGHPLALYARLRAAQNMPYGALLHDAGGGWLLSASPELFFRIDKGVITARPMKGTSRRLPSPGPDRAAASALAADPKNRAENLMITDLIRNDLSRVAAPASVRVENAFEVEAYPTVHQMVTTVKADLKSGCDATDILSAMFPCGSITGAPKVRAAQIISEVEWHTRGIYTGSIGWMAPDGEASFNVAIRTAELKDGRLRMGIGAGIVADSNARSEWRETLSKAAFLEMSARPFHLIETMRFDPADGILRLDHHMQRLKASAERLGFVCDLHEIGNLIQAVMGREKRERRVKLTLSRDGNHALALANLPDVRTELTVAVVPLPVAADDWRLFHKSSDRDFYDAARRNSNADEVIFARPDGLLTEGSFTNVFVRHEGKLKTPRGESGLLPGVLRAVLLESGEAIEADLTAADLAGDILVGNSLRGLIPAKHVAAHNPAA